MIDVKAAAAKVIAFNTEFGYTADRLELANDVWVNHMSPADRYEIMQHVNNDGLSALAYLRKSVAVLADMIESEAGKPAYLGTDDDGVATFYGDFGI
jgi:hypothetical protein